MGLQEPRQVGDGASRAGSQSEFLVHSQDAGGVEILSPFNRKTKAGGKHPDRDVEEFHAADQPAISIDAKKKDFVR
jgi:hypothetical protein